MSVPPASRDPASSGADLTSFKVAWGVALLFYFVEYLVRSSPAIMLPELGAGLKASPVQLSGIIGSYYYTYSVASLVAGALLDRFGARWPLPTGLVMLGCGCALFPVASVPVAEAGRLSQGAGSAFAFTGGVYLAAHGFSKRTLATAVGFTQCMGMFGGWVGEVGVGPLIHGVVDWRVYWLGTAAVCGVLAAILLAITPAADRSESAASRSTGILKPFGIVFTNVQSYLCGLVAGLLFVPTTVGIMIWGVPFFQQGKSLDYHTAVMTAAMVPLGWVIGCPLLGWLSDRFGRRKPVIFLGSSMMIVSIIVTGYIANTTVAACFLLLAGIGSGAAMIPYSVIKEANPDSVKGSATGVINFLTFGISAVFGPLFAHVFGARLASAADRLGDFRAGTWFWVATVVAAMLATLLLRETGEGSKAPER